MVLKKEKAETYLLARYVTSRPVVGGFTKLLKHVIQEYPNIKEIITFSDHMVSDGSLYAKSGFILDRELPPDYYYVENNVRKHKFNFRLKRFKEDANLIYREGCSEKELADLNGIDRIWDAGKSRWRLPITR